MTDIERRTAAARFAADWHGRGDEKQETQRFWIELLTKVFGVDGSTAIAFEVPVKLDHTSFIDGYIESTRVLIEQKGRDIDLKRGYKQSDGSMLTPYQQARRYAGYLSYSQVPRWIVVCNFQEFQIHDMNRPNDEPEILKLANLEKEFHRLQFLVDTGSEHIKKEMEISLWGDEDRLVEQPKGKSLRIGKGLKGVDFKGILGQVSQYMDIGYSLAHIEKLKQYVVQVPLQYQKALNEGTYFINRNQTTGVMWPSLMEVKENGRWGFIDNLPIVEQEFVCGNPMRDISMNFYHLALQNQIVSIADAVERTYKTVERIEHGQMDDRIALLYSGQEQIGLAMVLNNPDEKKQALALGRQSLIDAKHQLGMTLKRRIEEFEPIPEGWFAQRFLAFCHKGIFDQRDNDFQEMQDYYELYLGATKLVAVSYAVTGDIEAAKKAYVASIDFIKSISFDNVRTIQFIHNPSEVRDSFVYHPVAYIEAEQEDTEEEAKEYDYMFIEATGEDLLEVLGDVQEV